MLDLDNVAILAIAQILIHFDNIISRQFEMCCQLKFN